MIIKVIAGMQILFYKGRKNGVYTQDFQKDFELQWRFIAFTVYGKHASSRCFVNKTSQKRQTAVLAFFMLKHIRI